MKSDEDVAIICSARINAMGIAFSLREIGWPGRIVCLAGEGDGGEVSPAWPDVCETWKVNYREPGDLIGVINGRLPSETEKILFFTDERFMPQFVSGPEAAGLCNTRMHLGSAENLNVLLDRRLLYRFVKERELAPVPKDVPSSSNPFEIFPEGCRVRVWQSFRGSQKLIRGGNVTTFSQLEEQRRLILEAGLRDDEWCYQELLSTRLEDCVSVAGWHDERSKHYCVTRWALQARENGMIVERTEDPGGLEVMAQRILEALDYRGVFEMEFLRNPRTNEFNLVEINPRFWMQHRLTALVHNNALVRRYVGWDAPEGEGWSKKSPACWVHTQYVLKHFSSIPKRQLLRAMRNGVWGVPPGRLFRGDLSRWLKRKVRRIVPRSGKLRRLPIP